MADTSIRALVVDDASLFRKIITGILKTIPGVEVVGSAPDGIAALEKIASLKPDIVTLDIEMPQMNGIEVLEKLRERRVETGVIVVSTLTTKGGEMTLRALELGAFDFITKPQSGSMAENMESVKGALTPLVHALAKRREIKSLLKLGPAFQRPTPPRTQTTGAPGGAFMARKDKSEIVAIGISTGGPNALAVVVPAFPANISVPILIVQHMPPVFTASLAKSLDAKSAIHVKEAEDGEPVAPGKALIAPGGRHMKVEASHDGKTRVIRLTDDPPVNSCRPSVDYLFKSVAQHYVGRATGVIMTGMGSDGFEGLKLMKKNGAIVIAQDEQSSVVYGMPKGPVEAGIADVIAPLGALAQQIVKTVK